MSTAAVKATLGERLSERLNPIIVKEVRQGLRTRVFWIFFALMLLACLVVSLIAYAATRHDELSFDGDDYFFAFFGCLAIVHFFVIPYSAYRSLAREREDETWVLLTLTGLGPRRILRGKLGSFLVQAALYGSAATPFMLFSYYLNGIDLPTILVIVGLGGAYTVFLTALSVSAASLAQAKILRALVHFAVLAVLLAATGIGIGFARFLSEEGGGLLRERYFFEVIATVIWLMVSFGALLFEGAASRLSMPTEHYARGPRLVFVAQLAVSAVIATVVWEQLGRKAGAAAVFEVAFALVTVMVGAFLVTDRDGQSPTQQKLTGRFSLLRPGALRGYRLVMLALFVHAAYFTALFYVSDQSDLELEPLKAMLAAPAYVALYLSLAMVLGRLKFLAVLGEAAGARLMLVSAVFVGATLPPLVGALIDGYAEDPALNLFNPVVGLYNFGQSHLWFDGQMRDPPGAASLVVLWAVTVVMVLVTDGVLAQRDKR